MVLDTDPTEHEEPLPNALEMTTMPGNIADDTDRIEPQPTACLQTEEPAPVERNKLTKSCPTMA